MLQIIVILLLPPVFCTINIVPRGSLWFCFLCRFQFSFYYCLRYPVILILYRVCRYDFAFMCRIHTAYLLSYLVFIAVSYCYKTKYMWVSGLHTYTITPHIYTSSNAHFYLTLKIHRDYSMTFRTLQTIGYFRCHIFKLIWQLTSFCEYLYTASMLYNECLHVRLVGVVNITHKSAGS